MGKQVNFYMTDFDEDNFVQFVRADRNVGIFMYAMPNQDIPLLTELPKKGIPFWFALWLWDRDHSPAPKVRYVPEQKYFVVEGIVSEVIEFSRSHFDEDRLVRGRIWAETAVWQSDGSRAHKNEAFRRWFDRLANWIKRHSVRNKRGEYLMPGAVKFSEKGGKLVESVNVRS
jgi:hypothetical protein